MPLFGCGVSLTSVRTYSLPTVAERLFTGMLPTEVTTRAVYVSSLGGASDVPIIVNKAFVSDIFRFAFCFGANDLGTSVLDPMLIRWSDQEDVANWTPSATNQAGSLRLSRGSEIITTLSKPVRKFWSGLIPPCTACST
jgi:hypothetical protein